MVFLRFVIQLATCELKPFGDELGRLAERCDEEIDFGWRLILENELVDCAA